MKIPYLIKAALSKTIRSEMESDHYIVEAQALNRDLKPIVVHGGFERGMTDNGQPCWSEHSTNTFKTAEEALAYSKFLSSEMWGFKIDPKTVKAKRVIVRNIEYYDEYDVDEAAQLIQNQSDSYTEYMRNR
jgi:hypothetical protein